MHDLSVLRSHLAGLGRSLLGYSGGVDSALLAVAAREALGPAGFLAVIGRSASYPEAQWRVARELAERFAIPLLEVDTALFHLRRKTLDERNLAVLKQFFASGKGFVALRSTSHGFENWRDFDTQAPLTTMEIPCPVTPRSSK